MSMIIEQVRDLREISDMIKNDNYLIVAKTLNEAADTIEELSAKLSSANMERSSAYYSGGWIPCSEPPKDDNEVLIFNGKSYSVGYYNGKEWVNAIHPVEWQEIKHEQVD